MTIEKRDNEKILSEEQEIKMEMQNESDGSGGRVDEDNESTKPRVRLPILTKGIMNPVAITQLQDELEDANKELDKLRATRVISKAEMIVPKKWTMSELIKIFPEVGERVLAKMYQNMSFSEGEYETKIKKLEEQRDEYSRHVLAAREMESNIHKAEEKLRELEKIAKTHPNAPIGDVWANFQERTLDGPKNGLEPRRFYRSTSTNGFHTSRMTTRDLLSSNNPFRNNKGSNVQERTPKGPKNGLESRRFYRSTPTNGFHTSRMTTRDLLSSNNPFGNNRGANSDSLKRNFDGNMQVEFGKDVKRLKTSSTNYH